MPELSMPRPESIALVEHVARGLPIDIDVTELLTNRAGFMGLASQGRTSAGGSCELLATNDPDWVAVNLARPSDLEAMVAVTRDADASEHPVDALTRFAASATAAEVLERCQMLGVPAARLADPEVHAQRAAVHHRLGTTAGPPETPLVVDLSSMWAGPLCARLLGRCGMEVIKVESTSRPDGARAGNRRFFEWLLDGHEELSIDFGSASGIDQLTALARRADVVIEASRPRALHQLGIDPEVIVAQDPGTTWVSITGYGRSGPRANWVAFGDDAAVAGGLVGHDQGGDPVFCGDAIADPLTGIFAASATLGSLHEGGGQLVDVAMSCVARTVAVGADIDP
ncbi:MAG: CoA transferase [Microthrixaceae bacterium]